VPSRVVRTAAAAPPPVVPPPAGRGRGGRLSLTRLPERQARVAGVVRSALLGMLALLLAGAVGGDYVGAAVFSLVVPLLGGAACGYAATRGAGRDGGAVPRAVTLAVAAVDGGAAAGFAFHVADTPFGPVGSWLPPVLAGAAGALLWPVVDPAPPVHRPINRSARS
jgi:hypothetical protein